MDLETKKRRKHLPLAVSVIIGCVAFIATLSTISYSVSYNVSKNTLYERYQSQMTSIVDTIESYVDHDDMYNCVQTQERSEKYYETQKVFDSFAAYYSDIHYIYILQPVDDPRGAVSVIAGNTEDEYEAGEEIYLGMGEEDWYEEDVIKTLKEIYSQNEDVFFFEESSWGMDYTLARPVANSKGQKYGLLCVDVSTEVINTAIKKIITSTLYWILGIGLFFIALMILWFYFFVIRPIRKLQTSVTDFANSSKDKHNPEELVFYGPRVIASREIQELSNSVEVMSNHMRDYVINISQKEKEVQTLDLKAYQDALTGVKNKAAYDRDIAKINDEIKSEKNPKLGVVMVDINNLKNINDTYGHDSGDIYIVGAAHIVSEVYKHSPVYRIGGDEIVVILEGEDYQNRDKLLKELKHQFEISSHDTSVEEFRRYSAAAGMAVFDKSMDEEVYSVFRRADKKMYANKVEIKNKEE